MLVIWGEKDRFLSRRLAEPPHLWVPNLLSVDRLPEASHWVVEDCPQEVNTLLRKEGVATRGVEGSGEPQRRRRRSGARKPPSAKHRARVQGRRLEAEGVIRSRRLLSRPRR